MSAEPRRVVFGIGTPRTLRAHWMLEELSLAYETRAILPRSPEMQSPEFVAHSRCEKVPLLEDGDVVIGESGAIVLHLADRYRERAMLSPQPGSAERSRFYELCFFILTEIDARLYAIRMHEGLPEVYGAAPAAATAAREYFLRSAAEMERRLADAPYLQGDAFGAADLLLVTCLDWARFVGVDLSAPLAAYRDRVAARPAYGRAMATNFPPEAFEALRRQASGDATG